MSLTDERFDWAVLATKRVVNSRTSSHTPIAYEEAASLAIGQQHFMGLTGVGNRFQLRIGESSFLDDAGWQLGRIGQFRERNRSHCSRFSKLRGMRFGVFNRD